MSYKQVAKNTGRSGRVNLSGPELQRFGSEVGEPIKIDVAESKDIAHAIIDNSENKEFVIISKPGDSEIDV
ncbi:hypothetical protein ACFQE8_07090 [Salinirubellus sp. GCM10025818]|uniref:hypothetical protein n=1 Tax=Salinirubellus TaxID=2162630 RepID=UPI0030D229CD